MPASGRCAGPRSMQQILLCSSECWCFSLSHFSQDLQIKAPRERIQRPLSGDLTKLGNWLESKSFRKKRACLISLTGVQMLRLLFVSLILIVVVTSVMGVDPSCTLAIGAHGDSCRPGQGETLAHHLVHATNAFPDLLALGIMALIAFTAPISFLFTRAALPPPRHLLLTPERPPRFA